MRSDPPWPIDTIPAGPLLIARRQCLAADRQNVSRVRHSGDTHWTDMLGHTHTDTIYQPTCRSTMRTSRVTVHPILRDGGTQLMSIRQQAKDLVNRTPLGRPLRRFRDGLELEWSVIRWRRKGRPAPPPHIVRQRTLRACARRYRLWVLVESGTSLGDMVAAMLPHFDRIYSIELSQELHQRATQRLAEELAAFIRSMRPSARIDIKDDSVRITP